MRVSYEWLKDYVEPGIPAEELADKLTLAGIEVGALETFGQNLPGVIVGEVKALEPHPGKSNLLLVDTDVGDKLLKIVCGAKNMQPGDKVPVALPGSVLPGERHIEEAVIYGVSSPGMICSARELDLELGREDEIMILERNEEIGAAIDRVLGFGDKILCLELTPNRSDCLSMLGVAFEVAAITDSEVVFPDLSLAEEGPLLAENLKVDIADTDLCSRYAARAVNRVGIGSSPLWMQLRLIKAGVRPINNVVDITNYVMLEFGQPLHAFDFDLLESKEILVRRAENREKITTLDGIERTLNADNLVITDGKEPVALAGVMGGENTEINENTGVVLIEAASFNPTSIRKTSRLYNLPSEASQRFEKGVNPEAVAWSLDRSAALMSKLAGGVVFKGLADKKTVEIKNAVVSVSPARINAILGLDILQNEMETILMRLGFNIEQAQDRTLNVSVPLRRPDITLEEDIAEEVARLYGYDRIPVTLPRGELIGNRLPVADRVETLAKRILTACGYYECITHSFINPQNYSKLRIDEKDPRSRAIPVQNPFSEEQAVMRTTILPGLLKVVQHNYSHRRLNQMLFEIGTVYESDTIPPVELPVERSKLALAVTGNSPEPNWLVKTREADFYTVKGALEALFAGLQVRGVSFVTATQPFCHPTRCALIMIGEQEAGFLGQLHPEVAGQWEIDQVVTVGEIDFERLVANANLVPRVSPLPRFPVAVRDLALVVDKNIPAEELEKTINKAGGKLVSKVALFDLYEGKQVPAGKRSLAYSLTFRSEEATLTDEEVNGVMDQIKAALFDLGATLRA